MKTTRPVPALLVLFLAGCTTTTNLPQGARLVGGGLLVRYEAPAAGTAILMEQTSGRMVATETLEEGQEFEFRPSNQNDCEVIQSMFGSPEMMDNGSLTVVPTNTFFQLYFVPAKAKRE